MSNCLWENVLIQYGTNNISLKHFHISKILYPGYKNCANANIVSQNRYIWDSTLNLPSLLFLIFNFEDNLL